MMGALLWRKRRLTAALVSLLAAVCYSRIHLGVHYPVDVLAGSMFGALFAFSVYQLLARYFPDWIKVHR